MLCYKARIVEVLRAELQHFRFGGFFFAAHSPNALISHFEHGVKFFFGPFAVEILRSDVPLRENQFVYFGPGDAVKLPFAIISFRVPTVEKKGRSTAMI